MTYYKDNAEISLLKMVSFSLECFFIKSGIGFLYNSYSTLFDTVHTKAFYSNVEEALQIRGRKMSNKSALLHPIIFFAMSTKNFIYVFITI